MLLDIMIVLFCAKGFAGVTFGWWLLEIRDVGRLSGGITQNPQTGREAFVELLMSASLP
jgi:hypothetical protein